MKCLILASGFGTRLYPVTKKTAKGLLPYKGKPVINHIIERLPADIDIHVNTNRKFENQYQQWQKTLDRHITLLIEPVKDEKQSLGAVGSVEYWTRQKGIEDDILVIASDNYFEMDMADFIARFNGRNALVAVYDIGNLKDACQFGIVKVDGDKVVELAEKPQKPQSSLVATACYIFPKRALPMLHRYCRRDKKDNLGDFLVHLIRNDELYAYIFKEAWFDIGSKWEQLSQSGEAQ